MSEERAGCEVEREYVQILKPVDGLKSTVWMDQSRKKEKKTATSLKPSREIHPCIQKD